MTLIQRTMPGSGMPKDISQLLIGEAPVMQQLRRIVSRVAPSALPVLIHGPTGAGKELVAAALHHWSGRRGNLVAFNICALSESMFEDALFGHVKGAFTGALRDAPGYLLEGDGGTVFLDEIGGLPLPSQAKLLRAVETRRFRPVGASYDRASEFRLIAATNDDLDALIASGRFRADLAYRLRGVVIEVPPLAARREDIALLARHFLEAAAPGTGLGFAGDALGDLTQHSWPGNVRELKHVVERAHLHSAGRRVTRADVQMALAAGRGAQQVADGEWRQRQRLEALLVAHGWDTAKVAPMLAVHRATVYRHMKRLGLEPPSKLPEGAGLSKPETTEARSSAI